MKRPDQPASLKTCSVCGMQKPLSAFLEVAGPKGNTYGNICSHCRKDNLIQSRLKKPEKDRDASGKTGIQINSKSKVFSDTERREERQKVEEEYHEDRDLNELLALKVDEKKIGIAHKEKEHRTSFLNKSTTLDTKQQAASKSFADKTKQVQKALQQDDASTTDRRTKDIHFHVPFVASQTGELKFKSSEYQKVLAWFGKGTPSAKQVKQVLKNPEKFGVTPAPSTDQFVEKNWKGPGSRKT
ncbi:MAG: hypothetical protein A3E85_06175 [Gammaproteobacteria bacterium RIFCSPHIGHO2_12_FULL_45_12]|nr:MAG: hypothetical protein A3E85_06175 [Gammaproteobacteria bacterium RIFCSPHIGHO2_12_FULL_45_12]